MHLLINYACYSEKQRKPYNKFTTCNWYVRIKVRSDEH